MGIVVRARVWRLVVVCFALGLAVSTRPAGIAAQEAAMRWDGSIERVSSTVEYGWPAEPAVAQVSRHAVSGDGGWVVFTLDVHNEPSGTFKQFFRRDRQNGIVEPFFGAEAAAPPAISADGNHIALETCEPWYRTDQAAVCDIYILDQRYWSFINASTAADGTESNAPSSEPMLSRDGRFLVFRTASTTLIPSGAAPGQIVLRDRDADRDGVLDEPDGVTIHLVSVSSGGEPGNAASSSAQVSSDGRFIAFRSLASNLVADDTNGTADVFLHDRETGETRRINVGWDGQEATPTVDSPAISMTEDGNLIAFAADDWYLMNPPVASSYDNDVLDVIVYDRRAGTLERLDVGVNGTMGDGHTYWPTFSADGRYISVVSVASNIEEPSAESVRAHVYVYDRMTRRVTRVSKTADGGEPDADSAFAAISADGSFVSFVSAASNLSPSSAFGIDSVYGAAHLSVSPAILTIPSRGGEATVDITAHQYVSWWAQFSEYSWLSPVTPMQGRGTGSITFTAYPNPEATPRAVTVQIGAHAVVVRQEPGLSFTSMDPSAGPATGGTLVTLTGTGFEHDMTVYFNGIMAPFEYVSSTTIRVVTPGSEPGLAWISAHTTDFRWAETSEPFRYLDATPPEVYAFVSGTQQVNGWYTSDVIIDWVVYDGQSAVTTSRSCMRTFVRTDTAGRTFTCSATSEGGTTVREVYIQRDATPPIAHIAAPQNTLYPRNSTQLADPVCFDSASGVASCIGSVPTEQPFDTSATGYHEYSLEAVDHAGWRSRATSVYAVSNGECDARPSEMIAWWPGDGTFRDVLGGLDGVLADSQAPEFIPGMSASALYFRIDDGRGVRIGDASALRLTDGLTLSAWISNWNATQNAISVIAGKEGEYLLGRHYDGRIHYSIANAAPGWGWVDTGVVADWNVWTHLALTYDGAWIRLYKNGQLAYSRQGGGAIGDADPDRNDFRIGIRQAAQPGSEFGGGIDNLQVVGRALTEPEIQHAFFSAPHGHCIEPSTLTFPNPLRALFGQASTELVVQLTRNGVPQPNTAVHFTFFGNALGASKTDSSGVARVTVPLSDGLAVNTYANAVEARVDQDLVLTASRITADFAVEKGTPLITWQAPQPILYGTPLTGVQLNARANAIGDFAYLPPAGTVLPVGRQTLSATFTPVDANYNTASASVTLVVDKATPTVSVVGGSFTYDGLPHAATATATGAGGASLGPLTLTYDGSADVPVNAGTYAVVASFAGDANHTAASSTTTLTINKATPKVTATGGTFIYNGTARTATGSATGAGGASLGPLTFTYNGSTAAPVNAGTYNVVATFAEDANYTAASATTTLTITKATPTITATGGTFVYDGQPHGVTATAIGAGGESLAPLVVVYNGSSNVPVNAGDYAVVVSFAGDANYTPMFTSASIFIQQATPIVDVVGGSFTYDGVPHEASGTVTGAGGVSLGPLSFTYNGSPEVPLAAGSYAVVATYAGDANHSAASGTATLTIGKAMPLISAAGGVFAYDAAPHAATGAATGLGGVTLSPLTFTYNGAADVPVDAGQYAVVASFAGDANHQSGTATATLTIEKATPVVSANGGTFVYDATPHPAIGTATGINGADLGPLTFTYNGSPDAPVNAGEYAVIGTFAGNVNYTSASATATISIGKASPRVQWGAPAAIVYGTALGSLQLNATAATPGTFTYAPAPGTVLAAGGNQPLAVTFTPSDAINYTGGSASTTISVSPAPLTVRADDAVKRYGAPLPALTATASGFVNGDSMASLAGALALSTPATAQSAVGVYPIVASGISSPNYAVTFVNGTLTVVRGLVVVGVTASPEPSGFAQPMTFRATVAAAQPAPLAPGGVVRFFDGSTLLGTATLNAGVASLSTAGLDAGTRAIEARFDGDGSFGPGGAAATHVIRSAADTPAITLSSSRNPANVGQTVTVTAEVTTAAGVVEGTIRFYSAATLLGESTLTGGRATLTMAALPAGSHAITAEYTGAATPSRSGVLVQAIGEPGWKDRPTAMTLTSNGNPSTLGDAVVFTATVTGSMSNTPAGRILITVNGMVVGDAAGLPVTAASGSSASVTVTVRGLAHGRHIVTATYLGDPTYKGSTAQITQGVN